MSSKQQEIKGSLVIYYISSFVVSLIVVFNVILLYFELRVQNPNFLSSLWVILLYILTFIILVLVIVTNFLSLYSRIKTSITKKTTNQLRSLTRTIIFLNILYSILVLVCAVIFYFEIYRVTYVFDQTIFYLIIAFYLLAFLAIIMNCIFAYISKDLVYKQEILKKKKN